MFVKIKFVNVKNGKVAHVNILMYVYIFEACRVPGWKLILPLDVIHLYLLKKVKCYLGENHLLGNQLLLLFPNK